MDKRHDTPHIFELQLNIEQMVRSIECVTLPALTSHNFFPRNSLSVSRPLSRQGMLGSASRGGLTSLFIWLKLVGARFSLAILMSHDATLCKSASSLRWAHTIRMQGILLVRFK